MNPLIPLDTQLCGRQGETLQHAICLAALEVADYVERKKKSE